MQTPGPAHTQSQEAEGSPGGCATRVCTRAPKHSPAEDTPPPAEGSSRATPTTRSPLPRTPSTRVCLPLSPPPLVQTQKSESKITGTPRSASIQNSPAIFLLIHKMSVRHVNKRKSKNTANFKRKCILNIFILLKHKAYKNLISSMLKFMMLHFYFFNIFFKL